MNLITLIGPHPNPKTSSPNYNPNARCAYHFGSPGPDTNDCWALNYKIQNMINAMEIEFGPPKTPNVKIVPMPNHEPEVSAIDVVSATEDSDGDSNIDSWIFPTTNGGLSNWTTKDFVPINFVQE